MQPLSPPRFRFATAATALVIGLTSLSGAFAQTAPQAAIRAGFVVMDLATGKVLTAQNAREAFIPASVAKIPSALGILDALGPEHRFITSLLYTGTLKKGVIDGDLILVGGGDPMLDHKALEDMIIELKARKITNVAGRFLYVSDALPALNEIDSAQPPDASYNPPIDGLGLDFNRFRIRWVKGVPTGAEIELSPLPVDASLLPDQPPPGNEMWLPVTNPGQFTAEAFRVLAATQGYTLPKPQKISRTDVPTSATVVLAHQSPTVAEMVQLALFYSNNVAMEGLALQATKAATLSDAGADLTQRVQRMVPTVAWGLFNLQNASGLSSESRITPGQCAALTAFSAGWTTGTTAMRDLLPPVSTETFGRPTPNAESEPQAMRAKSGTMYYARALTGVATTNRGHQIAYCVMQDDQAARATYDKRPLADRTGGNARTLARAWVQKARKGEEALIKGWLETY